MNEKFYLHEVLTEIKELREVIIDLIKYLELSGNLNIMKRYEWLKKLGEKTKMSDKEVTEEAINDKLDEIMEAVDEKIDEKLPQIIRLLAKLMFNVRFDLNELKLELLKVLKNECEEVNHKKEEEDGRFYT